MIVSLHDGLRCRWSRSQVQATSKNVSHENACSPSLPASDHQQHSRGGVPRMHHLTLRFLGTWEVYEAQLQLSRWSSSIVELCMCGMLAPSFAAAYDSDTNTAVFHCSFFLLQSLWAAVAISRRFYKSRDPLFGKHLFEWVVGSTVVVGLFAHAFSVTEAMDPISPSVCDGFGRFMFGPMAHSTTATVAVIMCHVLHLHPMVKLLLGLSITLCTVVRPVFPFGMDPEIKFVVVASLAGYLFGYALEWQLRESFAAHKASRDVETAQRRADSRLNHVVKGLCGGASGLLLGLKVELEQNCQSEDTLEALDEVRAAPRACEGYERWLPSYGRGGASHYAACCGLCRCAACWTRPPNGCTSASSSYSLRRASTRQGRSGRICALRWRSWSASTAISPA